MAEVDFGIIHRARRERQAAKGLARRIAADDTGMHFPLAVSEKPGNHGHAVLRLSTMTTRFSSQETSMCTVRCRLGGLIIGSCYAVGKILRLQGTSSQTQRRDSSEASQLEGQPKSPFCVRSCSRPERFTNDWRPEAKRILPAPRGWPTGEYRGGSEAFGRQVDRHSNSRPDRIRPEPRIKLLNKVTLDASGILLWNCGPCCPQDAENRERYHLGVTG